MKKAIGIRCLKCEDEIYSKSGHDMVWCKCGNAAVDGGPKCERVLAYDGRFSWRFIQYTFDDKGVHTVADYDGPPKEE
jgi:hypothetical protein